MGYPYKWCSMLQLCQSILAQLDATDKTYPAHVRPSPRTQVPIWEQHATMIALPGLALVTGRVEVAKSLLLTFAQHVDRGMLPNRFPDAGEAPEYNTVDAALA